MMGTTLDDIAPVPMIHHAGVGKRAFAASKGAMEMTSQPNPVPDPVLASYRKSIDNIDAALIHMLAERFRITQAVGEHKAKSQLPASDPGREARQIERLRSLAIEAELDPEFSEKFIRFVIDEVIRHHHQAAGK
jgi:chorismate mutase